MSEPSCALRSTRFAGLARVFALALVCLAGNAAHAQAWPAKPIKLVVPVPPGGTTDTIARIISPKLTDALGQPVIVENRPGANGNIGSDAVAKSPADGYTLMLSSVGTHAINQSLYKNIAFDVVKDFTHIAMINKAPNIIVTAPSFPAKSLKELVDIARARPAELSYASAGSGSSGHLSMELLKVSSGISIAHIPYKGGGPALNDAIGGVVPILIINFDTALPHVKSGRLRAMATTGTGRSALLPEVPTVAESGFANFSAESWNGLTGPAKLPRDVVARMNAEIQKILVQPDFKERLATFGMETVPGSSEQMTAFVKNEVEKWERAVKASGAKID